LRRDRRAEWAPLGVPYLQPREARRSGVDSLSAVEEVEKL